MNLRYINALILLVLMLIACQPSSQTTPDQAPPNIIMILGDDHGYEYFGFMGSKTVYTPHLDKLANESVLFTNCHVTASVCPPSLRSLLTGLYPYQYDHRLANMKEEVLQNRFSEKELAEIPQEEQDLMAIDYGLNAIQHFETLPKLLAQTGYLSFEGGKYWEGTYDLAGFSDGMTKSTGPEEVKEHGAIYAMAGGDGLALGRESNEAVYSFIDQHQDSSFYVWYAPMLPHTPHDPPQEFLDLYANKGYTEATTKYYANISRFDARVGELIDFLEEKGLREHTLIFYVADNGYEQNPDENFHPMGQRRGKGSLHEMGFRSPLIFNWPGHITPARIEEGFVSSVDLFQTVLDFAGAEAPEGLPGTSIKTAILAHRAPPRDTLFGSMHQLRIDQNNPQSGNNPFANDEMSFYLTTDKWHFIHYEEKGKTALYDRQHDPLELYDLSAEQPALIKKFKAQIEQWKRRMLAPS